MQAALPLAQRSLEIWGFAFQFAFKYFMLGQKWTYGKEGMVPGPVSARKKVSVKPFVAANGHCAATPVPLFCTSCKS